MVTVYNYDNFQIPQAGMVDNTDVVSSPRQFNIKMSNFEAQNFRGADTTGTLNASLVDSGDYTRTALGFSAKQDWSATIPDEQDAEFNKNPLEVDSSLKYIRDDQFVRMGMGMGGNLLGTEAATVVNAEITPPKADVMDTKVVEASGMDANINYPTEGWTSFGGKYDEEETYQG